MLDGEHSAGSAHPCLHLVHYEQDLVLARQCGQLGEKLWRWNDDASLPLDRFHDDGRHIFRWNGRLKIHVSENIDAIEITTRVAQLVGTSITVRVRHMSHARHKGREMSALHGFASSKGQRAHRSPMEAA